MNNNYSISYQIAEPSINVTNEESWILSMLAKDYHIITDAENPYSCAIIKNGVTEALGLSLESLEDAIKDCREKYEAVH